MDGQLHVQNVKRVGTSNHGGIVKCEFESMKCEFESVNEKYNFVYENAICQ